MLNSPYRLTALTVGGILFSGAAFLCSNLHFVYSSLPLLAVCFGCVVVGVLGMYWAGYRLREGVQNELWPDGTLAPFRRITDHMLWKVALVVLLVLMLSV